MIVIQVNDTSLTLVRARGNILRFTVPLAKNVSAKADMPAALKKLAKDISRREAVLFCLPEHTHYCTALEIPVVQRSQMQHVLRSAIEQSIPEEYDDVEISTTLLPRNKKEDVLQRVQVIAVRKDVVEAYRTAATEAGLLFGGVTTASLTMAQHFANKNALLVQGDCITWVQNGCIVDESILPDAKTKDVLQEVQQFVEEAMNMHSGIQDIFVLGSKELFTKVETAFTPQKKPKKKKTELPKEKAIKLTHVLASATKTQWQVPHLLNSYS